MTELSRRAVLAGAATIGAATISGVNLASPAKAAAPLTGKSSTGFFRRRIGDIEVTSVHDGIWLRDADTSFVRNADFGEVQKAFASSFSPSGKITIPFTPLVVNTGSKLVMIDTATAGRLSPLAGNYMDNFTAAGFDPKSVDVIAISHFHPDHINGIRAKDESLTFANAEIHVPAPEWSFWMNDENMNKAPEAARGSFMNARRVFKDLGDRVKQFDPGKEVVAGINSIAAPGHTPGHTAFAISSGGQTMLHIVDTVNVSMFVQNPGWHVVFDANPTLAEQSRRKLLDMASTDKLLTSGYHLPFPGAYYVLKSGNGYQLVTGG